VVGGGSFVIEACNEKLDPANYLVHQAHSTFITISIVYTTMPRELMVGRCDRCDSFRAYRYEERHQVVCIFCLSSGFLVHMRLIPKEPIDPEEVAIVKEQYFTWEDYCGKYGLNPSTDSTYNREQRIQGLPEDLDT